MYITIKHKTNNLSKSSHRTISNNRSKALKTYLMFFDRSKQTKNRQVDITCKERKICVIESVRGTQTLALLSYKN